MAAEYSRDLSLKVTLARRSIQARGLWPGGSPPFGYRREVLDAKGLPSQGGDPLVWKKRQGVHTHLVLGPEHEVRTVQRVFAMYSRSKTGDAAIARRLNSEGIVNSRGEKWSAARIRYGR
ncbi:recombinase family protein [Phenylobacterium sp. J426]|uniref:recombinase family protein n=1 Tax=Phenylobacterium sp. J426 TaxID=2898439 RepID=UPI0035B3CA2C